MKKSDITDYNLLFKKTLFNQPLEERLAGAVKSKFLDLDATAKNLYLLEICQMCKKKLTIDETSQSIEKGIPPLCMEHQDYLTEEIEKLAPLLENLTLF